MSHQTKIASEKDSPDLADKPTQIPMAVQIMVNQRQGEKAQRRYEEFDLDADEEYLNEFKKTKTSRNNAQEATSNAENKFNKTIKSKFEQDLSELLYVNNDQDIADDVMLDEDLEDREFAD